MQYVHPGKKYLSLKLLCSVIVVASIRFGWFPTSVKLPEQSLMCMVTTNVRVHRPVSDTVLSLFQLCHRMMWDTFYTPSLVDSLLSRLAACKLIDLVAVRVYLVARARIIQRFWSANKIQISTSPVLRVRRAVQLLHNGHKRALVYRYLD